MRKEFNILQKQIHIHEREIKRIQSLVTKYAIFRGMFLGELKREKKRSEQQNDIMAVSKVELIKVVSNEPQNNANQNKEKNKAESPINQQNFVACSPFHRLKRSIYPFLTKLRK